MFSIKRLTAVVIVASLSLVGVAQAKPHHKHHVTHHVLHLSYYQKITKQAAPTAFAEHRSWSDAEWHDFWTILFLESSSTPGNVRDLYITEPCYGAAQFASPEQYAEYGGSWGSVNGELTGMANYIVHRYGDPAGALSFHYANNYY